MTKLKLEHLYKFYKPNVVAVCDFNFEIDKNEFIVIVGPSGCGKSTTLRMIAGLEEISYGNISIDDEIINEIEAKDRNIAMVFQNYALYPHLNVYNNLALGLKFRKFKKDIIKEKIDFVSKKLQIDTLLTRKPNELSGGQKQRVALGRALVKEPKIFLFDEPLSNLDAKLRSQMRLEILSLYNELSDSKPTTFIYVTHDQVEAMTMGTKIIVMNDGLIQQIDTPMNLYNFPANIFVAKFIGNPQMNVMNAELCMNKDELSINILGYKIYYNQEESNRINCDKLINSNDVLFGIRPEDILICNTAEKNSLKVKKDMVEKCGADNYIYGRLLFRNNDGKEELSDIKIIIRMNDNHLIENSEYFYVKFNLSKCHLFDSKNENTLIKSDANKTYIPYFEIENKIAENFILKNNKNKK